MNFILSFLKLMAPFIYTHFKIFSTFFHRLHTTPNAFIKVILFCFFLGQDWFIPKGKSVAWALCALVSSISAPLANKRIVLTISCLLAVQSKSQYALKSITFKDNVISSLFLHARERTCNFSFVLLQLHLSIS